MLNADDRPKFSNLKKEKNQIQIFIVIFEFGMKNTFNRVKTSLYLVQ